MLAIDVSDEIVRLYESGQTDAALDLIFRWTDHDLRYGGAGCQTLLGIVAVEALDENVLVGLLMATAGGRSFVSSRAAFAERVRTRLASQIGTAEATQLVDELT